MEDLKEVEHALNNYIRPLTFPVAIKMLKSEDEIPEKYRDHAWFVALAPVDQPKMAISVLIENAGHGGSKAAPIARELIKEYLGK